MLIHLNYLNKANLFQGQKLTISYQMFYPFQDYLIDLFI